MSGRLILASASPRRIELLGRMGVVFEVIPSDVGEECAGSVREQVMELSLRKARSVSEKEPGAYVIGADTLVAVRGEVLTKPLDETDAARMLRALSGGWHEVYTGVALVGPGCENVCAECSRVRFTAMNNEEIRAYIATGEPMDKAGAYGIQGFAGQYIDRIDGCYFNIMGLPMARLREMLIKAGLEWALAG